MSTKTAPEPAPKPPSCSNLRSDLKSSNKSSPASSDPYRPLEITLGCEFEFLLARYMGPGKATPENTSDYHAPGKKMVHGVLKMKLTAVCEKCVTKYAFKLGLRICGRHITQDYGKWQLAEDGTVEGNCGERQALGGFADDYGIYCLELKSRKFSMAPEENKACGHPFTYTEEITAVLQRLEDEFCGFSEDGLTKAFLFTNQSCGFHFHVGTNLATFPLSTVKKVMCLSLACERQIDGLHARDRINGFNYDMPFDLPQRALRDPHVIDDSTYAFPLTVFFIDEANTRRRRDLRVYGQDLPAANEKLETHTRRYPQNKWEDEAIWNTRRGNDIDSWIILVRNAPNVDSLRDLHHRVGRRCVLNIDNVPPWGANSDSDDNDDSLEELDGLDEKKTIEFKQHAGTLQQQTTLSFINFATYLITFCYETGDEDFYQLIGFDGKFRGPGCDTLDLCWAIGCSTDTRSYYAKQQSQNSFARWPDNKEQAARLAVAKSDPIGDLALNAIELERNNQRPSNVQKRITSKWRKGGYGQFTGNVLDVLLPTNIPESIRQRLTLGNFGLLNDKSVTTTKVTDLRYRGVFLPGYRESEDDTNSESDSVEALPSDDSSNSDHLDFEKDSPDPPDPPPSSRKPPSSQSESESSTSRKTRSKINTSQRATYTDSAPKKSSPSSSMTKQQNMTPGPKSKQSSTARPSDAEQTDSFSSRSSDDRRPKGSCNRNGPPSGKTPEKSRLSSLKSKPKGPSPRKKSKQPSTEKPSTPERKDSFSSTSSDDRRHKPVSTKAIPLSSKAVLGTRKGT